MLHKQEKKKVEKNKKPTNKKQLTEKEIIQKLEKEIEEQKTNYLTSLADLENDRKRFDKSKRDFIRFANEGLLNDFINVLGTFNMAMNIKKPTPEVKKFLVGFEMISNQFTTLLQNNGIEIISTKPGDNFNPDIHSSVEEIETQEVESGKVVSVIKDGYTINKRLLRPVMVKIAK